MFPGSTLNLNRYNADSGALPLHRPHNYICGAFLSAVVKSVVPFTVELVSRVCVYSNYIYIEMFINNLHSV